MSLVSRFMFSAKIFVALVTSCTTYTLQIVQWRRHRQRRKGSTVRHCSWRSAGLTRAACSAGVSWRNDKMRWILSSALNFTSRKPYRVTCTSEHLRFCAKLAAEDLVAASALGLQMAGSSRKPHSGGCSVTRFRSVPHCCRLTSLFA